MRDRFLQWLTPKKLDLNDDSILDLWTEPERSVSVRIGEKELETVRAECAAVEFDVDTLNAFRDILRELNDAGIVVSDRRSKAIIRLVKASAWLNERTIMSTGDLECVWTALWADESQIATVKKVVRKFVNPERQVIDEIFENSQILMQSWKVNPLSTTASDVSNQLKTMRQKLNKIKTPKPVNRQSFELTEMLLEKFQEAIAAVIAQKAGQLGI
jgi:MoxR-like ATPase